MTDGYTVAVAIVANLPPLPTAAANTANLTYWTEVCDALIPYFSSVAPAFAIWNTDTLTVTSGTYLIVAGGDFTTATGNIKITCFVAMVASVTGGPEPVDAFGHNLNMECVVDAEAAVGDFVAYGVMPEDAAHSYGYITLSFVVVDTQTPGTTHQYAAQIQDASAADASLLTFLSGYMLVEDIGATPVPTGGGGGGGGI